MAPRGANAKAEKREKNKKTPIPHKKSDASQNPAKLEVEDVSAKIPLQLQQLLLHVFRNAFPNRFGSDLKPLLQEVKQHLYNREFTTAFGKDEYLETYAVRWSPSRALGYLKIFCDLEVHVFDPQKLEAKGGTDPWKFVCLGGGAGAEIVALAGYLKLLAQRAVGSEEGQPEDEQTPSSEAAVTPTTQPRFVVSSIDIANWSPIIESLQRAITTAPTLSKYASAAAKESNINLLDPEIFNTISLQHDILAMTAEDLSAQLHDADLVTLMFTLNELYSTSLSQTQAFLLKLTESLRPGSLLLVVDSPGSYSAVTLNGAEKKYPMQWLLDHTLLALPKDRKSKAGPQWDKVVTNESKWFRLSDDLKYPIDLENMRYQMHLYKRNP